AARCAAVVAGVLVVDVLARERRLGAGLAQHLVLSRRQLFAPFLVGPVDGRLVTGHTPLLSSTRNAKAVARLGSGSVSAQTDPLPPPAIVIFTFTSIFERSAEEE